MVWLQTGFAGTLDLGYNASQYRIVNFRLSGYGLMSLTRLMNNKNLGSLLMSFLLGMMYTFYLHLYVSKGQTIVIQAMR